MARNKFMNNFTISGLLNANNTTFTTTIVTKLFNQNTTTTTTTSTTTLNSTSDFFNTTIIQNSDGTPLEKFFVSTKYCLSKHHDSFCNYVSFCIFLGYVLRFLIMPFLIVRIDKLKLNLRNDYNFSLTWLWLFATGVYIDIVEYVLTGDTTVYTRFITLLNIMLLIMVVVTIAKYMYFYGYKESNLKNYMLGIVFLLFWISISMIRIKLVRRSIEAKYNNNKKFNNGSSNIVPIYVMIYLCFAIVQVSKNVINETGRCLTHMAFGLWLINLFFFSPYQIVVSSHNFDYIHYRTFFEMTTLLVILMQNIYYRDRKYSMTQLTNTINDDLIGGREMSSNVNKNRIFKRSPLSKEFSNSGYVYFNDENNIIDENKLYGGRKAADTAAKTVEYKDEIQTNANEEDEVYFDKLQLSKKVNSSAVNNDSRQEKVLTVDYNEELQSNELPMNIPKRGNFQAPTTPLRQTELRQPMRQKIGIFFSYSSSRLWIIMLIVFCTFYYLFSCFLLFRAVKKNPFLILCPFVHPITILVAWTYKRWVYPTRA